MIPYECLTTNTNPDDYLPVDLSHLAPETVTGSVGGLGTDISNNKLPQPASDGDVLYAFTHFDGVDRSNKFDPSLKDAVNDEDRTIQREGPIVLRRSDAPDRLEFVGVNVESRGWRNSEFYVVRFDIDRPIGYLDEDEGELVIVSGAELITSGIEKFFPRRK